MNTVRRSDANYKSVASSYLNAIGWSTKDIAAYLGVDTAAIPEQQINRRGDLIAICQLYKEGSIPFECVIDIVSAVGNLDVVMDDTEESIVTQGMMESIFQVESLGLVNQEEADALIAAAKG